MAIQGPTNFRANKTTAKPGEEIIFTWTAATGDFDGYILDYYAPNLGGVSTIRSNTRTSVTYEMPDESRIGYKPDDYFYMSIFAAKGIRTNEDYDEKGPTTSVKVYYDVEPSAAAGKLEQFQNSAGEQIYPRTIIEGIFRQSDSKPLSELLSGIELPLRIADGGTGADNAQTALANLIDGADTSFQAASYGDVYIPISINGVGYRMPFTKVQLWTIGDRKSAVNQINTDYGIFMARGIAAGTSDYAAGSTAMTSGTIYLVYE